MLARWYLLLRQFSVTFKHRPGSQHANVDGMSRQCGQCQRPDCPVSATDSPIPDTNLEREMVDQPFAASEIGESMDAVLLPELSVKLGWLQCSWRSSRRTYFRRGVMIAESRHDNTLATVRGWIQSKSTPAWVDCAGLSPELRCWRLQVGNLSIDTEGRLWRRRAPPAEGSQLSVPRNEGQDYAMMFGHISYRAQCA